MAVLIGRMSGLQCIQLITNAGGFARVGSDPRELLPGFDPATNVLLCVKLHSPQSQERLRIPRFASEYHLVLLDGLLAAPDVGQRLRQMDSSMSIIGLSLERPAKPWNRLAVVARL